MSDELQKLVDEIFGSEHTDREWLELEKRTNEYFKNNWSYDEHLQFLETGAGETLDMMCAGIRYKRDKNKRA